jgi:membrane fusion protein (multidrug efflux system)
MRICSLFGLTLVCGLAGLAMAGCSEGPGGDAPAATRTAADAGAKPAAGAAPGAGAAGTPVLLVAAEDQLILQPRLVAGGPVISGSLQPQRRADLRSEISAVVLQVLKENGEPVRRGDLLVRLDDTAIRDSLGSAEESVRAVRQQLEQAERQLARLKTLQAQGMTSLQALEDAEIRRNNAQSDLVAAQARAATAQQQLRRTEVRAPFDGVVSERKVSAGDTAAVGKELLKVIDPGSMRFEGLVSADRMRELQVGQAVAFRVNGFPQTEFRGRVERLDATANATTRQVEVVVAFEDRRQAPRVAGLFAEGRIESGSSQVLSLPEAAIVLAGEGASAWRLQGNQLQKVPLQLGERDPRRGEFPVLAGLSAGDRVLRKPGSGLVDGQRFEPAMPALPPGSPGTETAPTGTAGATTAR